MQFGSARSDKKSSDTLRRTCTWLLEGEIVHHDSLGCEGLIRPGGANVMTAGNGIAHAEETPRANSGVLNGVQLWVALPEAQENLASKLRQAFFKD